jgi:hypothetical protein
MLHVAQSGSDGDENSRWHKIGRRIKQDAVLYFDRVQDNASVRLEQLKFITYLCRARERPTPILHVPIVREGQRSLVPTLHFSA